MQLAIFFRKVFQDQLIFGSIHNSLVTSSLSPGVVVPLASEIQLIPVCTLF